MNLVDLLLQLKISQNRQILFIEPDDGTVVAQLNGDSHIGIDYKTLFGRRWLSDEVRKCSAIYSINI